MSPNGTSSICCCSRYFRRSSAPPPENPQNSHLEPIEIKVNGQPHLMIPHVALRPSQSAPPTSIAPPVPLAVDTLSEINLELFETARTSRTSERNQNILKNSETVCSKLHPMVDLIRMIRIEEGLEVTPRVDVPTIQPSVSSVIHHPRPMETIPEIPKNSKPRRAVFNEEGDITSRSSVSNQKEIIPVYSIKNARRVSIESIGVPIITIPSSSSSSSHSKAIIRSSPISRRISSAPQMITALVAYTYAILTTMFTSLTNLFSK
uniref:Flocculation protein FLO11-like n=1 Tax=Caenorhabditis tropicalis TaxID=1561998 RepID=A0A1I7T7Q3_9PELO